MAGATLRLMDWVPNAHHGVALPYIYWTRCEWDEVLGRLGLTVECWQPCLNLYPPRLTECSVAPCILRQSFVRLRPSLARES
jgi:hypothetical protein